MKKMTYVEALNFAITSLEGNEEVVERLTALRDATIKRNSADRKPSKTQAENESIKAEILAVLADGTARTVTEIMGEVPALANASNQKASALVGQLKESGLVTRELIKRKAYFKVA
jgi:hypothetical protein